MDDQDPVAAPPRRIAPAQRLKGAERCPAANVEAFRIGDNVPGDVARQVAAFGAMADLLAIVLGLGLRPRRDDDGGPPLKRGRAFRESPEVGALADVAPFGGVQSCLDCTGYR